MARKPKAKRRGRPPIAKGAVRQVYSVRLLPDLAKRAQERAGGLTPAIEFALIQWLADNQGAKQI
jgi:hypothetical protein